MKKFWILIVLIITFFNASTAFASQYADYGKTYYTQKNYTNAKAYFEAALKQDPSDYITRYYYGNCLVYLGQIEKAKAQYNKVANDAPNSYAARYAKRALYNIETAGNAASVTSDDNYIFNALNSNGQKTVWSQKQMPLYIYITPPSQGVYYKEEYKNQVKMAFSAWAAASKGMISFAYVRNSSQADIIVEFENSLGKSSYGYTTLGLTNYRYKGGYMGFARIQFATRPFIMPISETGLYNTALHEIGHSLGISGHSDNKRDIMSTYNSKEERFSLSKRDVNTLLALYNADTVIDSKRAISKKREEAREFSSKTPDNPQAWVNLAETYYADNKIDDAIYWYKKAVNIDKSNESALYGLSMAYWKTKNFSQTQYYFKQLVNRYPGNSNYLHGYAFMCYDLGQYQESQRALSILFQKFPASRNNKDIINLQNAVNKKLSST